MSESEEFGPVQDQVHLTDMANTLGLVEGLDNDATKISTFNAKDLTDALEILQTLGWEKVTLEAVESHDDPDTQALLISNAVDKWDGKNAKIAVSPVNEWS